MARTAAPYPSRLPAFILAGVVAAIFAFAPGGLARPRQTSEAASPHQPPAGSASETGHILRVRSRLVVVDVTVTNSHGEPVQGLHQEDFAVFENGRRQPVVKFQPHVFIPQVAQRLAVQLPPGEYSNIAPPSSPVPALNIILFDVLNTPMAAQINGRVRMVQFLKNLPLDQPTALFELSDHLTMIAGFSTNSTDLLAALDKLSPHKGPFSVSQSDAETQAARETALAKLVDSGLPAGAQPILPLEDVGKLLEERRSFGLGRRVLMTSDAFAALAQAVEGYPGRKNVLWLSSGFPLRFSPKGILTQQGVLPNSTAEMLSSAQVAVFPIDIHGLKVNGPSASSPDQLLAGPGSSPGDSGQASVISAKESRLAASEQMMTQIASDTGGQAFYNTNDLKSAFRKAIEDGSTFYTLAYVPPDQHWNGQYRRIKVTLDGRGMHLAYRRGYYAAPWKPTPAAAAQMFTSAMQPGIPESTMLAFHAKVEPPDATHSALRITYQVPANDIAFQDSASRQKRARIEFVSVAYAKDGTRSGVASQIATLNLQPAIYQQFLNSGAIAFHQQLQLKPGGYDLRLGILDQTTGRFGTIDVALRLAPALASPAR